MFKCETSHSGVYFISHGLKFYSHLALLSVCMSTSLTIDIYICITVRPCRRSASMAFTLLHKRRQLDIFICVYTTRSRVRSADMIECTGFISVRRNRYTKNRRPLWCCSFTVNDRPLFLHRISRGPRLLSRGERLFSSR